MELEDYLNKEGLAELRATVISEVGSNKPRVAGELAVRLNVDQIPQLFSDLLGRVRKLAKEKG